MEHRAGGEGGATAAHHLRLRWRPHCTNGTDVFRALNSQRCRCFKRVEALLRAARLAAVDPPIPYPSVVPLPQPAVFGAAATTPMQLLQQVGRQLRSRAWLLCR